MRRRGRRRRIARRALAALLLLAAASRARADGINILIQPEFALTHETTTLAGQTTFTNTTEFGQLYRLDVDRHLFPFLDLNFGGVFRMVDDWVTANTGSTQSQDTSGNGYVTLALGSELLGGSIGYQRVMDANGVVLATAATNVADTYFATFSWRPIDLPSFNLRLDHQDTYDSQKTQHNTTAEDVIFNAAYRGISGLNLLYTLQWTDSIDHIHLVDTSTVTQTGQAIYNDFWFGGLTNVYASGLVSSNFSNTSAQGIGGTVSTQQFPTAGLSIVEALPQTPQMVTLNPNPLLIDGVTNVSANIDIGYGPYLAGDKNYRDMGVQFPNAITPVNTFWVYVNQTLPAQVSGAFTWTAYQSTDNVNWTQVNLAGAVVFNTLMNRFEIPINPTQAIYLKLVTTPLPTSVTTDHAFQDIFITEIQVYNVVPAASVVGSSSFLTETLNATARTRILDVPSLFWDFATYVNHSSQVSVTTWSIANALSLSQKLTQALNLQARVARLDQNFGTGVQGQFQWSAGLTAAPIPTFTSSLTYNGIWGRDQIGTFQQEAVYLFNNAALYTGLNLLLNAGYAANLGDTGRLTETTSANIGLSAIPNRTLTLTLSYQYQYVTQSGGPTPPSNSSYGNATAAFTWTPVPAFFFSGSVSRIMQPVNPTTLLTGSASFSPFQGGALLLRASYNETLDTFNQVDQRIFSAGLRYVIRTGWFIDAGYTYQESYAPQTVQNQDTFQAQLTIIL